MRVRELLTRGFEEGLVVPEGLAAHGRGEAFDYILGERTTDEARKAVEVGVAILLAADKPVLSVNGNAAALVPVELVKLANVTSAKLEVNLFHGSVRREKAIASWLGEYGAGEVLGVGDDNAVKLDEIRSDRRKVDKRGIAEADAVLVPLEDGDRTEGLKKAGKMVVTIDLNPMSRTARAADVTIVDNITRALPLMVETAEKLKEESKKDLENIAKGFDNEKNLESVLGLMLDRLEEFAKRGAG